MEISVKIKLQGSKDKYLACAVGAAGLLLIWVAGLIAIEWLSMFLHDIGVFVAINGIILVLYVMREDYKDRVIIGSKR